MEAPSSNTPWPSESPRTPVGNYWGGRWTRIALFILHIFALAAAFALTPTGYAFQLGYTVGSLLIFSCVVLWILLYNARTRAVVLLFCALALAQTGLLAAVGLRYRAEDRVGKQIEKEAAQKRTEWEARMLQFRMDPLLEMCSGKRQLSGDELVELRTRARAAQIEFRNILSEKEQWAAEAEGRLAAVSAGAARDFRRGVEARDKESAEIVKLTGDFYYLTEQLTQFLIERQGRFRVAANGLEFDRDEDVKSFNDKIEAITQLQDKLNSLLQKDKEFVQRMTGGH
jgi:hypothetical protein